MNKKDNTGETYYLIKGWNEQLGDYFKVYPHNVYVADAVYETMKYVEKQKESQYCGAV